MEKAYPFDPISSPREIRMLALNPGENEDPITCTLSHVSLDAELEYEALSYTWDTDATAGTGQDTKMISCSGHEIFVRENLFAALRRLRCSDRPRSIWIDALCINQADVEEKNHQVALMGSIYSNVKEVVIWLGEEEADDALAFDTIILLERIFEDEPDESDLILRAMSSKGGPGEIPVFGDNAWQALRALLEKRWFSRAWIVQEVALARKATLVCGDLTLHWQRLLLTVAHINASGIRGFLGFNGYLTASATLFVIHKIIFTRDSQKSLSLLDMLVLTCCLQATDPRDKIFSLLGVLNFEGNETEDVKAKKLWNLDYKIPIDELFRKVTAYYILDEGFLEILSFVDHGSRLDEYGTGSWVLPWYIPPENWHTPLGHYLDTTRELAKPIGHYPCNHIHPSHISISGVLVDQVRAVTSTFLKNDHKIVPGEKSYLVDHYRRVHRYISEC